MTTLDTTLIILFTLAATVVVGTYIYQSHKLHKDKTPFKKGLL